MPECWVSNRKLLRSSEQHRSGMSTHIASLATLLCTLLITGCFDSPKNFVERACAQATTTAALPNSTNTSAMTASPPPVVASTTNVTSTTEMTATNTTTTRASTTPMRTTSDGSIVVGGASARGASDLDGATMAAVIIVSIVGGIILVAAIAYWVMKCRCAPPTTMDGKQKAGGIYAVEQQTPSMRRKGLVGGRTSAGVANRSLSANTTATVMGRHRVKQWTRLAAPRQHQQPSQSQHEYQHPQEVQPPPPAPPRQLNDVHVTFPAPPSATNLTPSQNYAKEDVFVEVSDGRVSNPPKYNEGSNRATPPRSRVLVSPEIADIFPSHKQQQQAAPSVDVNPQHDNLIGNGTPKSRYLFGDQQQQDAVNDAYSDAEEDLDDDHTGEALYHDDDGGDVQGRSYGDGDENDRHEHKQPEQETSSAPKCRKCGIPFRNAPPLCHVVGVSHAMLYREIREAKVAKRELQAQLRQRDPLAVSEVMSAMGTGQ